jgi:hypothetical protein
MEQVVKRLAKREELDEITLAIDGLERFMSS